ncbi:MAG: hypothetical protein LBQ52_04890 [Helicobacteraceae bacterium]|jgi:hypothetical protein|nr:hypothetical protein [Helicobacteraceae bacterium]
MRIQTATAKRKVLSFWKATKDWFQRNDLNLALCLYTVAVLAIVPIGIAISHYFPYIPEPYEMSFIGVGNGVKRGENAEAICYKTSDSLHCWLKKDE